LQFLLLLALQLVALLFQLTLQLLRSSIASYLQQASLIT
jgi:hypothetical protein